MLDAPVSHDPVTVFPPWFCPLKPPMVCCKDQNSCPEFISFLRATILIGMTRPVLSFPVFWISAINIPFLQLSPSGGSFTLNHEGETQIHLACSWLTLPPWLWLVLAKVFPL